jgi:hypothetical protein
VRARKGLRKAPDSEGASRLWAILQRSLLLAERMVHA